MWERLKNWNRGTYVPPPENDPDSPLIIISPGYYKRPLLAKVFETICQFFQRQGAGIIAGIMISVVAGILLYLILPSNLKFVSTTEPSLQHWPALTSAQQSLLGAKLPTPPSPITIICVSNNCMDFAKSLATAFREQGWEVTMQNEHIIWGMGPHIRIAPAGARSEAIGKAIEYVTGTKAVISPEQDDESQIYLAIGERLDP